MAQRTKGRLKARFAAVRVRTADGPPSGYGIRVSSIFQATKLGSSASTAHPGRRNTISPTCPPDGPPQLSCDDQGTMDLRAGSSTVEGGTRSRSLRGKILARPSSSCADGDDCLRVPPTSPAQKSEAEKKNQRPAPSTDVASRSPRHRRPHHAIKSSAMSVLPILDQRRKSSVSKSAKVVLSAQIESANGLARVRALRLHCDALKNESTLIAASRRQAR